MGTEEHIKITLIYLEGGLRAEVKGDCANKIKNAKVKWLTLPGVKGESKVNIHVSSIRMFEVIDATVRETPINPEAQGPVGAFKPVAFGP